MDFIFLLQSTNHLNNLSIFSNVDKALDELAIYLHIDHNLDNYTLSKYILNENQKYVFDKTYNLYELININDILNIDYIDDDLINNDRFSNIDSDSESNKSTTE